MRLYLDTNVFISFWKDEIAKGKLPIYFGYSAQQLLEDIVDCKHFLVTSNLVALEVKEKYPYMLDCFKEEIQKFNLIKKVKVLEVSDIVSVKAVNLNRMLKKQGIRLGWRDCAHILLAKENADAFVSWEKAHKEAGELVGISVYKPNEF